MQVTQTLSYQDKLALIELHKCGKSVNDVTQEFPQYTRRTIAGLFARLAHRRIAPRRAFTPDEIALVRELKVSGLGSAEIGRRIGRDRAVVHGLMKKLDTADAVNGSYKGDVPTSTINKILHFTSQGYSASEALARLTADEKVALSTVRAIAGTFTGIIRGKDSPDTLPCSTCFKELSKQSFWFDKSKQAYRGQCRACVARNGIINKYGLHIMEGDVCEICSAPAKVIDHDHSVKASGWSATRGKLCDGCNTALGMFTDSPYSINSAREYLRKTHTGLFKPAERLPNAPTYDSRYPDLDTHHTYAVYGLTGEQFYGILASQGGRCGICGSSNSSRWCVDHSHTTEEIRGVLCNQCNIGLGHARESDVVLESMIRYLRKHVQRASKAKEVASDFVDKVSKLLSSPAGMTDGGLATISHNGNTVVVLDPKLHNEYTAKELGLGRKGELFQFVNSLRSRQPGKVVVVTPFTNLEALPAFVGTTSEVYSARETVSEVILAEDASAFLNKYHLQGSTSADVYLGLRTKSGELVAVMTFNSSHAVRRYSGEVLLQRFATRGRVRGGASKLLAEYLLRNPSADIVSYSDPLYSSGALYETLGFANAGNKPGLDYFYYRDGRVFQKSTKQRSDLARELKVELRDEMTESYLAKLAGYTKIYVPAKVAWVLAVPVK